MSTNDTLRGLLRRASEELRYWCRSYPGPYAVEGASVLDDIDAALAEPVSGGASVVFPDSDEIMQMAFEEGQPMGDASGYHFELEEFDLFIERFMAEVKALNGGAVAGPIICEIEPLTITAPTGEPARAWTEQEKSELIGALRQVADRESRNVCDCRQGRDACTCTCKGGE